jgi:hypothetical protein
MEDLRLGFKYLYSMKQVLASSTKSLPGTEKAGLRYISSIVHTYAIIHREDMGCAIRDGAELVGTLEIWK